MVTIRFSKVGRPHRQLFRLVAADSRSPRDGKILENLGTYDPKAEKTADKFKCNDERVKHWLAVGAQPSHRVWIFLRKRGINKSNSRTPLTTAARA